MGQILVLRALGLGDFLTALPALRALRRCADGRDLVLATHGNVSPLAAWSGLVDDQIIVTDLDHAGVFRPELAVTLQGSGPHTPRCLLRALPRALIAFANPEVDVPGPP